jgi:phage terminase small subunit|tara:strand:- start:672 stop:1121 length:450 start_codon:yes stop_codon:yes gene_type:complete
LIKRKRKLTAQQEKFVDLMAKGYHEGPDPTKMTVMDAFKLAGYSPDKGNAYRLYKDLKSIIRERRDDLVEENQVASLATKIIEDIMVNPEIRPEIRLKAAQDILHRTGHDKPKEVNLKQTVSDLSDAELDEQLSELIESSDNVKQLKQG